MRVLPGADMASGPVWMEYITFLKSLPVCWISYLYFPLFIFRFKAMIVMRWLFCSTHTHTHIFYLSLFVLIMSYMQAQTAQEESIRMTAIRKTYQKAIITPTHHVEQLWREYENFENSVSRQLVMFSYGFHLWSKPYSC